jgi:hypothetical protein
MTYVDVSKAMHVLARLVLSEDEAVSYLEYAIQKSSVDVTVYEDDARRPLAAYERSSFQLDVENGELVDPLGGPPLHDVMFDVDGLWGFVSKLVEDTRRVEALGDMLFFKEPAGDEPQTVAAQVDEPARFPGRPSVRRPVIAKMRERFATGEADKTLAAEARWLMCWAQENTRTTRACR